jgi:hypothetical protein
MDDKKMRAVRKNVEDAMVVMSYMEKRQTERLLRHDTELEELSEARARSEQTVIRLRAESAEFQRRTDQNLAEITDKLNGLIGYVEGRRPN